jgi:hypothetical protein
LLEAQAIAVSTTAYDFHNDIRAVSRFDTELAGEVVNGDSVSGENATLGLRVGPSWDDEQCGCDDA